MKNINIASFIIACLYMGLVSCKKNQLHTAPAEFTNGQALVKINYACPYFLNPAVIIKINGAKVSSAITYATPYPGGGLNTGGNSFADYLSVRPGDDTVSLSIPFAGTGQDSVLLHKAVYNFKPDLYQTLHFTDTAQKTVGVITIDASSKPDSGYTQYRFINLIPNSIALDLYFGTTKVASNVAFKAVTDTFRLPSGTSQDWSLRIAGDLVKLGTAYPTPTNANSVANQRVFTIFARGYVGPATTDIRSPKVSLVYNK